MARQARVVAVDVPHPVTHRGNNRQDVFLSDQDRRRYQNVLRDQLAPCGIDPLGWCWNDESRAFDRRAAAFRCALAAHHAGAFAMRSSFNRRYKRCGHLWQSRFFSCALRPAHSGTTHPEARSSLERLFRERGLPRRMRSDNGSPFASTGAGRLSRLNVWWLKLGSEW